MGLLHATIFTEKKCPYPRKAYFVTALSYMALGLFASLIIGLIIRTVGEQVVSMFSPSLAQILMEMGSFAMDTKIMGEQLV